MSKDNFGQYDATAANNTDVGGVNLAENSMLPSDVNNAFRTLMSHIKDFEQGTDSITKLAIGAGWTIEQDASNNLLLKYSGTGVLKVTSAGAIVAAGDITAFGSV